MCADRFTQNSPALPLEFFPVTIGRYHHHKSLDTEAEVRAIAELLAPFGAEVVHWDTDDLVRGADAVETRLREWAHPAAPRNTFLYWAGHGESDGHSAWLAHAASPHPLDDGMTPQRMVQRLATRQGNVRGRAWAIVVIDACKSARFVELMSAQALSDPQGPRNFLLVSTSEDGIANLGTFRSALSTVLRITFGAVDSIDLRALGDELNRNLHGCPVIPHTVTGRALLQRREPALAASLTTSLDLLAEVEAVLSTLSPDERRHFAHKASGAELGEQGWYFEGREAERTRILNWLDTAREGMFVVTGAAGSGKSALLGHVLMHTRPQVSRALQRAGHLKPLPSGSPRLKNPFTAVLHLTGATPHDVVARVCEAASLETPPAGLPISAQCDRLVAQLIRRRGPLTLLVDALDEAHSPLVIAHQILRPLAGVPRVRLVVGTRRSTHEGPDLPVPDDQDLLDALGVGPDTSVLTVGKDGEAMVRYLRNRLGTARATGTLRTTQDRVEEAARVLGGLDREFLHARLAAHEIVQAPALLDDLGSLTQEDHRQLFARAVDRLTRLSPVNGPLLQALALAQGHGLPLRNGVWARVASALAGAVVMDEDIAALTEAASTYLTLDAEFGQSVYRLSHRTFAEHFTPAAEEDPRHREIAATLIDQAAQDTDSSELNPYSTHYLAAHTAYGGEAAWQRLARFPHVLNRLDPTSVVTAVMRAAFGRFDLPPAVAGFVVSHHLLATAKPEERRGIGELATVRHAGLVAPTPSDHGTAPDPHSAWSVSWARLRQQPLHLPMTGDMGVKRLMAATGSDGQPLLAGVGPGHVQVWDTETGLPVAPAVEIEGWRTSAVFAGLGGRPLFVSSDRAGRAHVRDAVTGEPVSRAFPIEQSAWRMEGFADPTAERELVACLQLDVLSVWSVPDGRCVATLPYPVREWTWVLGSEARPLLATCEDMNRIRLWDVHDGRTVGRPEGTSTGWHRVQALPIWALIDPEGRTTVVTSVPDRPGLGLWDCETDAPRGLKIDPGASGWPFEVWAEGEGLTRGDRVILPVTTSSRAFHVRAGGRPLVTASDHDDRVRVWDLLTGSPMGEPIAHPVGVQGLALFTGPGGRPLLATSGSDGRIRIWDPAARTDTSCFDDAGDVRALHVFTGPDGSPHLASGQKGGTIRVWRGTDGTPSGPRLTRDTEKAPVRLNSSFDDVLAIKPVYDVRSIATADVGDGGTRVFATTGDGAIWTWDPFEPHPTATMMNHYASTVNSLHTLTRTDGRHLLVSGGERGLIRVWDISTGEPMGPAMSGHAGRVTALADLTEPGPHGAVTLISGGADGTVRFWDLASRSPTGRKATEIGTVRALTTLTGPNGESWLAACTSRGEIRTWDAVTGTLVAVWRLRGVTALATVRLLDRTYLAAGSSYGSVHVWDPTDAQVQLTIPLNIAVTALTALGADLAVGTAQGVVVLSPEWDMLASRGTRKRAAHEGAVANALSHVGRWRAMRSVRGLLRRVPPGW
ncbi:AAA family ATPase [Streptomyces afghaniensis]|uniref:AAA family ATPase n=1 Tax=Streptomyces afghaniensis TaxID=66865 RepID=UPI00379A7491